MNATFWALAALFVVGGGLVAVNQPVATAGVALGLVAFALVTFLDFRRRARELRAAVHLLGRLVDGLPPDATGVERLAGPPPLGDAWQAYRRALVRDPGTGRWRSDGPASRYFPPASVIDRHLDLGTSQAVPGLLVGTGICFTFLGLALALRASGAGGGTGDVLGARLALQGIYAAAAFKFATSIAAIAASVLYAAAERREHHALTATLDQTLETLDKRFPPIGLAALLLRQAPGEPAEPRHASLAAELRAMAEAERAGTAEAVGRAVGGAVEQALAGRLVPALEALDQRLGARGPDQLAHQLVAALDAATERVAEAHQARLAQLFAGQGAAIEGALGRQREGLLGVVAAFEDVLRRDAAQRAEGQAEHGRAIAAVRDAAAELQRYAEATGLHTGERISQLAGLAQATSGQTAAVEQAYAGLVASLDQAMATSNEQLKRYLETAESRQTHFFDTYDAAVTRLYEKLLQAANYLVEAEQQRREAKP